MIDLEMIQKNERPRGPKRKRITVAVDEETHAVLSRMAGVSRQSVSAAVGDFLHDMAPFMDHITDQMKLALDNTRLAGVRAKMMFEKMENEIKPLLEEIEEKTNRNDVPRQ